MVSATLERAAGEGYLALVETVDTLFLEEAPGSPKMMLDIPTFASLLERLVLDPSSYRPTTVRLLLNLALSEDSVCCKSIFIHFFFYAKSLDEIAMERESSE
jgi:hypothetical protein